MTASGSPTPVQEELDRLLKEGPVTDIYWAECAHAMYRTIGQHAESINSQKLGLACWPLQIALGAQHTLHVTRLFEMPGRFPCKSLPAVLAFIDAERSQMSLFDRRRMLDRVAKYNVLAEDVVGATDADTLRYLVAKLGEWMPPSGLPDPAAQSLTVEHDAIRTRRNKVIAHPEDLQGHTLPSATWQAGANLVEFAKDVVGALGWGCLNHAYQLDDGEYLLSRDAQRPSVAFGNLLRRAGVTPNSTT